MNHSDTDEVKVLVDNDEKKSGDEELNNNKKNSLSAPKKKHRQPQEKTSSPVRRSSRKRKTIVGSLIGIDDDQEEDELVNQGSEEDGEEDKKVHSVKRRNRRTKRKAPPSSKKDINDDEESDDEHEHSEEHKAQIRRTSKLPMLNGCPYCNQSFTSNYELSYHLKNDDVCKNKNSNNSDGESAKSEEEEEPDEEESDEGYAEQSSIGKKRNSRKSGLFVCPNRNCGKPFKSCHGLEYHVKNAVCQKKINEPSTASRKKGEPKAGEKNRPTKEEKQKLKCSICGRKFSNVFGLKYHIGPFLCRDVL
jgi:hypothetical protein